MKLATRLLKTAMLGTLLMAAPVTAQEMDRPAIEEIVRGYLLENPEILFEMQDILEARQEQQEAESRALVLSTSGDQLFNNDRDPVLGNPNGDVTIVEFFDYNCGFCRRAHTDMITLLESDPKVRVVLKEFPILGPQSSEAHKVSMAFHALKPDSYAQFMDQLITSEERANEASATALAETFGVSADDLRQEMTRPDIDDHVRQTYQLATALGITGTPTYIIGDEVLSGAVGSAELAQRIKKVRECAVTTC